MSLCVEDRKVWTRAFWSVKDEAMLLRREGVYSEGYKKPLWVEFYDNVNKIKGVVGCETR